VEYNPFSRETQINPYPVYGWLRDEAPVYHNTDIDFYALSRFDDVLQAHLDTKTFLSSHGVTIEESGSATADLLITKDDPEHTCIGSWCHACSPHAPLPTWNLR